MGQRWWGSGSKTYALGEAGTYYFRVSSNTDTYSNSTYQLTPSFELGLSGVETEPNGDHENADVLNFGEEMTGQLFYEDDVDWYKISVAGAGTLTLDRVLYGNEGESEWTIHLYREGEFDWSNPEWMMGHRKWGTGSKTYELGEAGSYYFQVLADSQTYSNSTYKLTPSFD